MSRRARCGDRGPPARILGRYILGVALSSDSPSHPSHPLIRVTLSSESSSHPSHPHPFIRGILSSGRRAGSRILSRSRVILSSESSSHPGHPWNRGREAGGSRPVVCAWGGPVTAGRVTGPPLPARRRKRTVVLEASGRDRGSAPRANDLTPLAPNLVATALLNASASTRPWVKESAASLVDGRTGGRGRI